VVPRCETIAFNSNLSGDHANYIVDVDGSRVVDLSRAGEGWAGRLVARRSLHSLTSHRDNPGNYPDTYVMRPDGSDVKRLTHDRACTPAWSPDGSHIVFSAGGSS
jgi:Tol biopolymer transport system component